MSTATVTSKGQITIPAEVRRRLGIGAGDRLEFVELNGGGYAIKPAAADVCTLKGMLEKPGKPVSVEDMNAAVRRHAVKRHRS